MKSFAKNRAISGFKKVNVDKMFAISGGSLTSWGRAMMNNESERYHYGTLRTETEKVFIGTRNEFTLNESTGIYEYMDVPQYETRTTGKFFDFNRTWQTKAGCASARFS